MNKKTTVEDPCLREILKQVRAYQKWGQLYDFHARSKEEAQKALMDDIRAIIRRYDAVRA